MSKTEIGRVKNVEIGGSATITWFYPEIYDRDKADTLEIELSHTRAADSIRIRYDSERDGWVIEQASVFGWPVEDTVCDPDWKEVAFIGAWAREATRRFGQATRRTFDEVTRETKAIV